MTKFNDNDQPSFDYESDEFEPKKAFYPPDISDIFLDSKFFSSRGYTLLGYLQGLAKKAHNGEISKPEAWKTKKQLAEFIYPDFYKGLNQRKAKSKWIYDGYSSFNNIEMMKKYHVEKVGKAIRSIYRKNRQELNKFSSNTEKFSYLREKAQLFVTVGQTQTGANLFAYHGPDFPSDVKLIEIYRELAAEHLEKQSQPKKTADMLYQALTGSETRKLDLDMDFDDDEDLEGFESF